MVSVSGAGAGVGGVGGTAKGRSPSLFFSNTQPEAAALRATARWASLLRSDNVGAA